MARGPASFLLWSCLALAIAGAPWPGASAQTIDLQTPQPDGPSAPAPDPAQPSQPPAFPEPAQRSAPAPVLDDRSAVSRGRGGAEAATDPGRILARAGAETAGHAAPDMVTLALSPQPVPIDDDGIARITGEAARARFVVFLPEALPGGRDLRLFLRSSIHVLPERSTLEVSVNGTPVATISPDNFGEFEEIPISLPPGVLVAGRNEIGVSARHTHRVFCGVEASFALWTDIDLRQSGIAVPGSIFEENVTGFTAALAAQAATGRGLRVILPGAADTPPEGLSALVAGLARIVGASAPRIELTQPWLLAQDPPDFARLVLASGAELPPDGMVARGGDGALVYIVAMDADFDAIAGALRERVLLEEEAGDLAGTAPLLSPGAPVALGELGQERLRGFGHYIRLPVPFRLPQDWVLLANQKARLDLDYRFARGLAEGSLLQVKINGTTIQLLPLDRDGGEPLPTLPVDFPARLLNPGANLLEFEALLPSALETQICPPDPGVVLEISEGSRLRVPKAPRMSIEDLGLVLSSLGPDDIAASDYAARGLSSGFLTQMAVAIDLAVPQPGAPIPGATLTIVSEADLAGLSPAYSLDEIRAMQAVLTDAGPTAAAAPEETPDTWDAVPTRQDWALPGRIWEAGVSAAGSLRRLVVGGGTDLEVWLADRRAAAILLQADPDNPQNAWLAISPRADAQAVLQAVAFGSARFGGPRGQVALYVPSDTWVHWTSGVPRLRLNEPLSPRNLSAVAGNYATALPRFYVLAILGLTALSALVALGMLSILRWRRR